MRAAPTSLSCYHSSLWDRFANWRQSAELAADRIPSPLSDDAAMLVSAAAFQAADVVHSTQD